MSLKMPFQVGDGVTVKTSLGFRYSADVVYIDTDPETKKTSYGVLQNGIFACPEYTPQWNLTPPRIFDTRELKYVDKMPEVSWHGKALTLREPQEGDAEKRAFWLSQIEKHDAAIADQWLQYAHIKKGMTVTWELKQYGLPRYTGVLSSIFPDFTCYVHCTDGKTHDTHISNLTVVNPKIETHSNELL